MYVVLHTYLVWLIHVSYSLYVKINFYIAVHTLLYAGPTPNQTLPKAALPFQCIVFFPFFFSNQYSQVVIVYH